MWLDVLLFEWEIIFDKLVLILFLEEKSPVSERSGVCGLRGVRLVSKIRNVLDIIIICIIINISCYLPDFNFLSSFLFSSCVCANQSGMIRPSTNTECNFIKKSYRKI